MTKTVIIDESGRVEIPAEYREKHSIKPGQKVRLVENPDGTLSLKIGRELEDLAGMLDGNGIHLTIEQINEAIARQGELK